MLEDIFVGNSFHSFLLKLDHSTTKNARIMVSQKCQKAGKLFCGTGVKVSICEGDNVLSGICSVSSQGCLSTVKCSGGGTDEI